MAQETLPLAPGKLHELPRRAPTTFLETETMVLENGLTGYMPTVNRYHESGNFMHERTWGRS